MDINLIIVAVYSYLLGSIPFGLILTKIFLKKDIRKMGSGNIGTTNVLRTGKKSLGWYPYTRLDERIFFYHHNIYLF